MGHLKNKSEVNLSAAEFLHDACLYPSVVHCAYYSCIQLMKHIYLYSMGKTEAELRNLANSPKEGSHEVLINQIRNFINSKSIDVRAYNRDILQLKRLRVRADYEDVLIDFSKSSESISLSKSTRKILMRCI